MINVIISEGAEEGNSAMLFKSLGEKIYYVNKYSSR
jgi:hypothetical protein